MEYFVGIAAGEVTLGKGFAVACADGRIGKGADGEGRNGKRQNENTNQNCYGTFHGIQAPFMFLPGL